MSSSVCTCYYRILQMGGLNNKHLCFPVLEAGESKINVLADSLPDEVYLPGLPWLPSCCVPWQEMLVSSLCRGTFIPTLGLHPHDPVTSERSHLQRPSHCRLGLQYVNGGWDQNVQSIADADTNFVWIGGHVGEKDRQTSMVFSILFMRQKY